jgi:hypothetical protein
MFSFVKKTLGWAASILGVVLLHYAWPLFGKIGEHAVLTWIDERIGERLGLSSPSTAAVIEFIVSWAFPAAVVALILGAWWLRGHVEKGKAKAVASYAPIPDESRGPEGQRISLANLCCYLAYKSEWSHGQTSHSPAFSVNVANEIRDALFQGKVIAYGRPFSPESPNHLQMKRPPRPIESSWWDGKFIDAWRAMNKGDADSIVYDDPQQRRSGYHEITVERASVERVWPPRSLGEVSALCL